MAKEKDRTPPKVDASDKDGEAEDAAPKKRFGKKFLLMAGAGALVLLVAVGAGAYFFFFSGSESDTKVRMGANGAPLVAPQVVFFDMPDIVVNIQSADGTPAYLKLAISLELDAADEKPGLQALMPRIVDQFQSYLRELRIDDLRGSAGVMRLKEELLRRINAAAAPFAVRDVLLKEMIVQ